MHHAPGSRVAVWTTQPIDRPLDYRAPEGGVATGALVAVPLGRRDVLGVVWGGGESDLALDKLKPVSSVLDVPPLRPEMLEFLERAGAYTLTPLRQMIRLATRVPDLGATPADLRAYRLAGPPPARMTQARTRVLDVLEEDADRALAVGELSALAGVGHSVVHGLVAAGTLAEVTAPRDAPFARLDPDRPGKELTAEQAAAAATLRAHVAAGGYGTTLLKGVTGSGKTEVYLEAVAECLSRGRQALVLLPEIALSAEFVARLEARFGAAPAQWHSGVTQAERRRVWKMAGAGGLQVAVGARSALYLPFADLGLIVVDEEHDTSYKQEDGVLYSARDMAVLRASLAGARVVLASATPSLESWANAEAGKYDRIDLDSRFGAAVLPDLAAIDMRDEDLAPSTWISPTLRAAVRDRLARGEQSLLFLNRRGYAPVTVCRACGHQIGCDQCDARMVEHRFLRRLMCHQCGETRPMPDACPACGVEGKLAPVGPGVERLAEEVAATFPDARLALLSSDLFASARALKEQIADIAAGGADIVIGTQLVAKGHNFPLLTLVGVIDADLGLQGSDLRAAERTFALMRQVAGRAGRADAPGEALLQTHQPDHPVIRAILSGEEERFWRQEAEARRHAGVPPYGRMAGIVVSAPQLADAMAVGEALAREDGPVRAIGGQVWGPAPAPIARVRGRHRIRLLVKADKGAPIQAAVADWIARAPLRGDLRLSVDIDPQSFL
ncbi:MAG: primosomal protein N' [Paracoccaceae bacterium]